MKARSLLLAGGAGTRLWPLSTERRPKQFLRLWGDRSLLRDAYLRARSLSDEDVYVATAETYAEATRAELPELSPGRLLLEPSRRNTAPAILSAALRFASDGDPVTAVLPADQTVANAPAFRARLEEASRAAAAHDAIVTLGVVPSRAETEYGYLEAGEREGDLLPVARFVEKPDRLAARRYLEAGNFYWNAGIFVFRPSVIVAEAERACPELLAGCRKYAASGRSEDYAALPSISIDYAVMEKASRVLCVPCDAGWSDVGSYRAIAELKGTDADGNLVISDRRVVVAGLREVVVAASDEGVLVFPFSEEARLREALREAGRS